MGYGRNRRPKLWHGRLGHDGRRNGQCFVFINIPGSVVDFLRGGTGTLARLPAPSNAFAATGKSACGTRVGFAVGTALVAAWAPTTGAPTFLLRLRGSLILRSIERSRVSSGRSIRDLVPRVAHHTSRRSSSECMRTLRIGGEAGRRHAQERNVCAARDLSGRRHSERDARTVVNCSTHPGPGRRRGPK